MTLPSSCWIRYTSNSKLYVLSLTPIFPALAGACARAHISPQLSLLNALHAPPIRSTCSMHIRHDMSLAIYNLVHSLLTAVDLPGPSLEVWPWFGFAKGCIARIGWLCLRSIRTWWCHSGTATWQKYKMKIFKIQNTEIQTYKYIQNKYRKYKYKIGR